MGQLVSTHKVTLTKADDCLLEIRIKKNSLVNMDVKVETTLVGRMVPPILTVVAKMNLDLHPKMNFGKAGDLRLWNTAPQVL